MHVIWGLIADGYEERGKVVLGGWQETLSLGLIVNTLQRDQ